MTCIANGDVFIMALGNNKGVVKIVHTTSTMDMLGMVMKNKSSLVAINICDCPFIDFVFSNFSCGQ